MLVITFIPSLKYTGNSHFCGYIQRLIMQLRAMTSNMPWDGADYHQLCVQCNYKWISVSRKC